MAKERPQQNKNRTRNLPCLPVGLVCLKSLELSRSQRLMRPTVVLAFAVCGGLAFEALRIVPELWSAAIEMFNRKLA